jgi:hypothetical protein
MRTIVAALILALATPAAAQLGAAPQPAAPGASPIAPTTVAPAGYGKTRGLIPGMLIGPKLSIISVPTPSIGLEAKLLGNRLGLSFDYDLLPDVDIDEVEVSYTDWNLGAKWYPWQRSFFVGAAFGRRTFEATATATEAFVTETAKAGVTTTYLAPEIGWRWVWNSGFFMGMDIGYQIVLSSDVTLEASDAVYLSEEKENVDDAADELGKIGFPIVSLLQVGYFF